MCLRSSQLQCKTRSDKAWGAKVYPCTQEPWHKIIKIKSILKSSRGSSQTESKCLVNLQRIHITASSLFFIVVSILYHRRQNVRFYHRFVWKSSYLSSDRFASILSSVIALQKNLREWVSQKQFLSTGCVLRLWEWINYPIQPTCKFRACKYCEIGTKWPDRPQQTPINSQKEELI